MRLLPHNCVLASMKGHISTTPATDAWLLSLARKRATISETITYPPTAMINQLGNVFLECCTETMGYRRIVRADHSPRKPHTCRCQGKRTQTRETEESNQGRETVHRYRSTRPLVDGVASVVWRSHGRMFDGRCPGNERVPGPDPQPWDPPIPPEPALSKGFLARYREQASWPQGVFERSRGPCPVGPRGEIAESRTRRQRGVGSRTSKEDVCMEELKMTSHFFHPTRWSRSEASWWSVGTQGGLSAVASCSCDFTMASFGPPMVPHRTGVPELTLEYQLGKEISGQIAVIQGGFRAHTPTATNSHSRRK